MRWTAWGLVAGLSLAALPAQGQVARRDDDAFYDTPPLKERIHMDLVYTGAPGCAEAGLFMDAVRVQEYRWDPFAPHAPWHLTIHITRNGPGYSGSGELRGPNGAVRWRGTLRRAYRCYDAVATLAFEVAVAISPVEPAAAAAPPAACTKPSPCLDSRYAVWPAEWPLPPLARPKADPPAPPERWPLAIRFGIAAWPEVVAAGWGSLGLSGDVGVRYGAFSVSGELHGDPPLESTLIQDVGEVSFGRVSGALLLCAHFGWFAGCGVADAGAYIFAQRAKVLPASSFYGAAGARMAFDLPVAPPRIFVRTALDLRAPIRADSYAARGHVVFAPSGLGFGLGVGVVVELPP